MNAVEYYALGVITGTVASAVLIAFTIGVFIRRCVAEVKEVMSDATRQAIVRDVSGSGHGA